MGVGVGVVGDFCGHGAPLRGMLLRGRTNHRNRCNNVRYWKRNLFRLETPGTVHVQL